MTPICNDSCILYASIHIHVESTCLCSFIHTVLNVITAAICICLTAKTLFFHLLCGMCGCPNLKICRQTGNSYGLFSPNNTIGARSDTCCDTGKNGAANKFTSVLDWNGLHKLHYPTRPHSRHKGRMVVIKNGFSVKPYKGNNSSAETVLTLYSDKYNRSNWSITRFTSPGGLRPVPD